MAPIPLQVSEFGKHKEKLKSLMTEVNSTQIENSFFKAQSLTFDSSLLKIDEDRSTANANLSKELEKSVYINEAFKILCDYIILNSK